MRKAARRAAPAPTLSAGYRAQFKELELSRGCLGKFGKKFYRVWTLEDRQATDHKILQFARELRCARNSVAQHDFCVHRLERGQLPACVETCPSKVRVFGDLNDPGSKLAELLSTREYRLKKPEAGTEPQIYYLI